MNFVKTAAPISIEDLKLYFTDKQTFYIIDYNESKLKGSKLLTYLSNLDIPANIDLDTCTKEEKYSLLRDYMEFSMIVSVNSLEFLTMQVIEEAKGLFNHNLKEYIDNNQELVDQWVSRIDSLTLYNMYIINSTETRQFAESFEKVSIENNVGINYVSLLKHQVFYSLYQKIDESKLKFYEQHFNEYIFKGKNLYSYWANENNIMFLLTNAIGSGEADANDYIKAKRETIKELENVSSI
jgi:hypothetical protein